MNGGDGADQVTDPMTKAIVKLTDIMGVLSKKKGSSLEDALDQVGGGSGLGDVSSSMGRKHAAARQALLRAFREEPKLIWSSIEKNMADDFHLQSSIPNSTAMQFSARGWCEHRSRIQPYIRTVRWVWAIAGVLGNLRAGPSKMWAALSSCGTRELGPRLFSSFSGVSDGAGGAFEQLPNPCVARSDRDGDNPPHRSEMGGSFRRSIEAAGQLCGVKEETKMQRQTFSQSATKPKERRRKGKGQREDRCSSRRMTGLLQQTSAAVARTALPSNSVFERGGSGELDGCGGAGKQFFEEGSLRVFSGAACDGSLPVNRDSVGNCAAGADTGGLLPDDGPVVGPNVPGAKASAVRIHSLWHSIIRDILGGSTPFAMFFQTMLRKPLESCHLAPTTSTWPMPLPYNRYDDYNLKSGDDAAFRKLINVQVGYLNYLHLGRPLAAPRMICKSASLNQLQRDVVARLERLCRGWHLTPEVAAGDMGRVAAKQERQEAVLGSLAKLAVDASCGLKKYGAKPKQAMSARPSGAAGEVVGKMSRDDTCGAQTIVASRLEMEGKPVFDPNPFS